MSGFGWDDGRMVVIADDEHWEQLKQVRFRTSSGMFVLTVLVTEGSTNWEVEDNFVSHI